MVQRYGMVIGLRPEKVERYRDLHADTWPSVLAQIASSNVRNYSIHYAELEPGKHYLFAYFEYTGDDFERDMATMAADAETQRWWRETEPCQTSIGTAEPGTLWSPMEEMFYFAGDGASGEDRDE